MKQLTFLTLILGITFFSCATVEEEKPQEGDLSKNTWRLVEYTFGDVTYPVSSEQLITARFEKGTVTGKAACANYFCDYSAQGVGVTFKEISTTKQKCSDELVNLEARFLNLMGNARNYTASLSKLSIFCTDGQLRFEASHETAIKRNSYADFLTAFMPLLLEDPHVYAVTSTEKMANYPFVGKEINTLQLDYMDPETANHYKKSGSKVYQIGKFKNHYLLRTPGKYASTDLTLFSLDKYHNRIKKEVLLAYNWCDQGACNQQDAWLEDVNRDGKVDVVTKATFSEDGKIQSTTMVALIQQPKGTFEVDESIPLKAADYVMAEVD